MTCDHCVTAVRAAVAAVAGVAAVDVDLGSGVVTISSEEPVEESLLQGAVADAGYEVVG